MLTFDEASHAYALDGRALPSVTQVLAPLSAIEYRGVDRTVMEVAAWRGRAVHKMIELDLRDDLDVASLADELQPYYTAWHSFLATSGFEMIGSERRVYSPKYSYAGTLDLAGMLNDRFCIIDAKRTAAVPRTAGPQTAAYAQALGECDDAVDPRAPIDRFALHLTTEGRWKLVPFTDRNDLRVFLSSKTLFDWEHNQ